MEIYLPIAEFPVNVFYLLGIGFITGILAGLFGIGGGFIMTPMLIFLGVPAPVSVATSTSQIVASSFSAFLSNLKRKTVDFSIGTYLLFGGFFGSTLGVFIFKRLQNIGQIDLVISACYIFILSIIGLSMAYESSKLIFAKKSSKNKKEKINLIRKIQNKLPLQKHFVKSGIEISIFTPIFFSFITGILVSIMGIGGGFILIPVMIYILGMPTSVAIGTSLFQAVIITANVTILHAVNTQTVDVILGGILLTSSVIGAQIGSNLGVKIPAEKLRFLLAIIVLAVALKLASGFFIEPNKIYEISINND